MVAIEIVVEILSLESLHSLARWRATFAMAGSPSWADIMCIFMGIGGTNQKYHSHDCIKGDDKL